MIKKIIDKNKKKKDKQNDDYNEMKSSNKKRKHEFNDSENGFGVKKYLKKTRKNK